MNQPISIHIDYDHKDYTPGDVISGTVLWTPESIGKSNNAKSAKEARVSLFYQTSGRGTKEVHVIAEQAWPAEQIKGQFQFTLPRQPYSFSGRLIALTWGLEAVSASGKETSLYEITLTPTGEPIILDAIDKKDSKSSFLNKIKFRKS